MEPLLVALWVQTAFVLRYPWRYLVVRDCTESVELAEFVSVVLSRPVSQKRIRLTPPEVSRC